jgi:hypothetical protein
MKEWNSIVAHYLLGIKLFLNNDVVAIPSGNIGSTEYEEVPIIMRLSLHLIS